MEITIYELNEGTKEICAWAGINFGEILSAFELKKKDTKAKRRGMDVEGKEEWYI